MPLLLLLGSLGDFASGDCLLGDGLDDADCHGLLHVADGEAAERRVFGERLDAHGLGWRQPHHGSVTTLHGLGQLFQLFARTTIHPDSRQN